jgi:hypothetical protein
MYNILMDQCNRLSWINTVYDKQPKKNRKTAEMAGLALYALF